MKLIHLCAILAILIFSACEDKKDTIPTTVVPFTEDRAINLLNPDRGFYEATYELTDKTDENMFQSAKDQGYALIYGIVTLRDYAEVEVLPSDILAKITKNLNDAKEIGIKIIFRIMYRPDMEELDPAKEIIQGHLSQLKATLQAGKEAISVVQAGTIGAWGEWHSFTGDYSEENKDYVANRRAVVDKLMDIFPDRFIQLRTPMHKELLYGSSLYYQDEGTDAMITSKIAFSNDPLAKVAQHNDCFISSETDVGTYPSQSIPFWQDYVINESKYSPIGGETCADEELYTNCVNALSELKRFQWSFLNENYHPDVIQRWKDEGCYREIKEDLGYRLVAKELRIQQDESNLIVSLDIFNEGFASPYVKSDVTYVLEDVNNTYEYKQEVDLRTFYPQETNAIKHAFDVEKIANGIYCLSLKIGESHSAIRLSNSNVWNEETLSNVLTCDINVTL